MAWRFPQNIFVNPEEPGQILGIIDCQSSSAYPLSMQIGHPAFLDYNGPVPENWERFPPTTKFIAWMQMNSGRQRRSTEHKLCPIFTYFGGSKPTKPSSNLYKVRIPCGIKLVWFPAWF